MVSVTCHPGQGVPAIGRRGVTETIFLYQLLTNLSTVAKSLCRRNETHLAVILASHQNHSL